MNPITKVKDQPYDEYYEVSENSETGIGLKLLKETVGSLGRNPSPPSGRIQLSDDGDGSYLENDIAVIDEDENIAIDEETHQSESPALTLTDSINPRPPAITTKLNPSNRLYPSLNSADPISNQLNDLFKLIDLFKPQEITVSPILKYFIPEYIPSVGDIDAFVKIPRPDNKPDELGLTVLDEPSGKQSDPATVLNLKLRSISKASNSSTAKIVKSLAFNEVNSRSIDAWISNIDALHQTKPAPCVQYSHAMPEIETLMQAWPEEIEAFLSSFNSFQLADINDLDLYKWIELCLSLVDIPVYDNLIESLHVLFTLYMTFQQSIHFQQQEESSVVNADNSNHISLSVEE